MEKEKLDRRRFDQLKWAIFHGQREMVESLLDEGAPVNNRYEMRMDFRSPLHSSIYLGDLKIVKRLLDRGASVNVPNTNNETAMMLAAKFDKYDIVDLLLSDKRLKNCANRENFTHLHIACMRNRVDVVEKLLEHKADVNRAVKSNAIRWSGFTPLHFAVQFKCIETIAFLLKVGADITVPDSKQLTALHLADMTRNDKMIDMILAAHQRVAMNPVNSEGLSHFHIACTRNNKDIVECFIKNGVALDEEVDRQSSNWPLFTALDFAMYYNCVDIAKLLLEQSDHGMFPSKPVIGEFYDRVNNAYCTGDVELANLFLYRDKLRENETPLIEKPSALHCSCIYEDLADVKRFLLQDPSSLNTPMWQGSTPLHLSVECGDERAIRYLLEQGADLSIKNADGKSPLHLAFQRNRLEIVKLFFNGSGCMKENTADNDGYSHLHIACIEDNEEAVARLMKLEVDVNAAVNFDSVLSPGFTPLHFAAKFGSSRVARYLLKHGASYSIANKDGQTAFDVAISNFQHIDQAGVTQLLEIMRAILSIHWKHKVVSFNDRGFSLLHVIPPERESDAEGLEIFIRQHQADINKAVNLPGTPWDGYTPLHFAMLNGEKLQAMLLVKYGADIASRAIKGDYPYHLLFYSVAPIVPITTLEFEKMQHNPAGSQGYSLFHAACAVGNVEWIKYFMGHGIDPNIRTAWHALEYGGQTSLHMATSYEGGSKLEVVKLLLENGADATLRDAHLNTPLHKMDGSIECEVIDVLLNHGVDVNSRNASFETPLLWMCTHFPFFSDKQLSEKIQKLLDWGADINLEDESGRTPLTLDTTWQNMLERYECPLCTVVLLKYIIKLKAMGAFINEVIERAYIKLWQAVVVSMRSQIIDFPDQCTKELELLKGVHLNISISLYDVLYKDLHGLYVMSGNNEFQQIINSEDFELKYPTYGPMLKLQLRKGKERRQLMTDAEKSLRSLTGIFVPRECSERIFQYNTNEDLKNIIISNDQ